MENMENDNISNAIFVMDYRNLESDRVGGDSLKQLGTVERAQTGTRKRITSQQLIKLKSFAETNLEFTKGTNKSDCVQELAWDCLAVELNNVGPPVHTSKEWRTVWSQYKGNKKRKISTEKPEPVIQNFVRNQSSLMSCSNEITVDRDDATPNLGVFKDAPDVSVIKDDVKDVKNDCMDKLLQKMIDLEQRVETSESKIIAEIKELKRCITEKFTSV